MSAVNPVHNPRTPAFASQNTCDRCLICNVYKRRLMESSTSSNVVILVLVASFSSVYGGCSPGDSNSSASPFLTPTAIGSGASVGSSGGGGSSSTGGNTNIGSSGGARTNALGGNTNVGGSGGGDGGSGGAPLGGGSGGQLTSGPSGGSTNAGVNDITKIVPTAGCGKAPAEGVAGMTMEYTIQTMGQKPADCADQTCGAWAYERHYFITLPSGYDMNKAYPLVLEGPGCGGSGFDVYPLDNNADNTVIRVGITPPPDDIGHATNPGQGCFDDKEGDDSVDWVLYENLHDKLSVELCFDKNRVFSVGNSSGSWFSNELGCKYAGDPMRPVRGIMPNTGGLPDQPQYKPTCTDKPMAGMWIHETNDGTNPFTGNKYAIARAMKVNSCTIGDSYDNTMFEDYPIGGGKPADTCKRIKGCDPLYPLVICELPGDGHGSHDDTANPGFSTFIKSFSAAPLVTQ